MCINTANAERVDTDALCLPLGPGLDLGGDMQLPLLEWD